MLHVGALGRANPVVPAVVAAAGLLIGLFGPHAIGIGVALGAALALANGAILSRRVDMAAHVGDVGQALLLMQLGFLLTCSLVAGVTIILLKYSIGAAVAAAAGFAVAQIGSLAAFYWTKGRAGAPLGGTTT
ncbi:MAG: hypothetical protein ACR2JC_11780 [Chloroflexota bacterium]